MISTSSAMGSLPAVGVADVFGLTERPRLETGAPLHAAGVGRVWPVPPADMAAAGGVADRCVRHRLVASHVSTISLHARHRKHRFRSVAALTQYDTSQRHRASTPLIGAGGWAIMSSMASRHLPSGRGLSFFFGGVFIPRRLVATERAAVVASR